MEKPPGWIFYNFREGKKKVMKMMRDGLSAEELATATKIAAYDMKVLEREFTKICPDYADELTDPDDFQVSRTFAMEILFEVGPASNLVSNTETKRIMELTHMDKAGKEVTNRVYVHFLKNRDAPPVTGNPRAINGKIHLTIRQASLLALKKMEKVIELMAAKEKYLLFPLAGNVFCGSVTDLHKELKEKFGVTYDIAHLLKCINESAYGGGENLEFSELPAAAAFTVASTAHLSNRDNAAKIMEYRVKCFQRVGKEADLALFELYTKYCIRGRLVRPDPNYLKKLKESEHRSVMIKRLTHYGLSWNNLWKNEASKTSVSGNVKLNAKVPEKKSSEVKDEASGGSEASGEEKFYESLAEEDVVEEGAGAAADQESESSDHEPENSDSESENSDSESENSDPGLGSTEESDQDSTDDEDNEISAEESPAEEDSHPEIAVES